MRIDLGPSHRWFILALAALTFTLVSAIPTMSMPVLFKEISEDLDLNLVQIGMVWSMIPLAGLFVVLIGGLLGDRFGAKPVLTVVTLIAGLTGALRGLSGSFISLASTMFLFGLLTSVIPTNIHKMVSIWFPGRHLAMAQSVVSLGMALGFTIGAMISATILSPLLGGWRNVFLLYGAISIIISALWFLIRSEPDNPEAAGGHSDTVPFRQAISRVLRIREVWFLGFILLCQIGGIQGVLGYLPLHLQGIGWTEASADGALAAFHATSMVGTIPLALLSDRFSSRKGVLLAATLMTITGIGLLSIASAPAVWAAVVIAGLVRDGFMAVFMTTVIETEGIGSNYTGTALGLIFTFSRIGSITSPPLGNSLANINQGLPFIFWAGLVTMSLFGYYFLRKPKRRQGEI